LAERALFGTGLDLVVDGVKLRCYLGDNATEREIFVRGFNEPKLGLRTVMEGIRPGEVFVDVGANSGIFTAFAAKRVGPTGRVVAIEPMPAMLERLRFNVAANDFTNVTIFDVAAGEASYVATLHIHPRNRGQSAMISPSPGSTPIEVSVRSLADMVVSAGLNRVDTLKIDVEGFEDRVLVPFIAQAPGALWPKRIFMEIAHRSAWKEDCVATLLRAGYTEVWRSKADLLLALGGEVPA
jgi:FkbM family methyltransferase